MSFVESGDKEVFKTARKKLFGSNEKQNDNHILVPDKTSPIHVCCVEVSLKNIFGYGRCYIMYTRHPKRWKSRRPYNNVY